MIDLIRPPNPMQRQAPEIPRSEAQQERVLTGAPMSLGYKPMTPWTYWGDDGAPALWEVLRRIEAMRVHPICAIAMSYYMSAIYPAEFEVKASSSEAGSLGLSMIRRFWSRDLRRAQLHYEYGWNAYEVAYEVKQGYLMPKALLDFSPIDVQVLTRRNEYIGVQVRNGDGEGDTLQLWAGQRQLPAKGLWLTHNRRHHRWYGQTQYLAAYKPWFELAARDGAEEVICNAIYRFGYAGPIVRFPQGSEKAKRTTAGEDRQDFRDKAQLSADSMKTGVGIALNSAVYPGTNVRLWDVEFPDHTIDVSGLITFDEAWCKRIFFGIGTPPEILEASETGSGYSGRNVPKEAFFVAQQYNAEEILQPYIEHVVNPCLRWNLGPKHWIEAKVKPLLKSQVQQAAGMPGQDGQQQPGQPGAQPGGAPQQPGQPPTSPAAPSGNPSQGSVPDLSAIFGGGAGKPKMMGADRAGTRWLSVDVVADGRKGDDLSDTVQFPETPIGRVRRWIKAPKGKASRVKTLALINPASKPIAADLDIAKVPESIEYVATDAIQGYTHLIGRIRRELLRAMRGRDPIAVAAQIEMILRRNQPALSRLLADAKLAASLAGALDLARRQAGPLSGRISPLFGSVQDDAAAEAARGADRSDELPGWDTFSWVPIEDPGDGPPLVVFPMIELAAADLAGRRAMTRTDFDALEADAREGAFTVAGLATATAVEKVQDVAVEAVAKGLTLPEFAKQVEETLGTGTFLSPQHAEVVFRNAVHSAYAAGQDRLLDDPRVGNHFPYVARYTTHDDRVRPGHRQFETSGIQGTNIFRRDDPVFQKYRAPFDFGCRCNDTYLTIRQAADKGIDEAREWLRTGEPPMVPAFVPDPNLPVSSSWQRLGAYASIIGIKWLSAERLPDGRFAPKGMGADQGGALVAAKPNDEVAIDPLAAPEKTAHKFSTTQFNLADSADAHDVIAEIEWIGHEIPDSHLSTDGRETVFHITLLYGLHDDDPAAVRRVLEGTGPVTVKLGKLSLFPPDESQTKRGGPEHDILKIDVESKDLERLHEKLSRLPHTDTHPKYQPHITIAYLRPGLGKQHVGDWPLEGKEIRLDRVVFNDRAGNSTPISLAAVRNLALEHTPQFLNLGITTPNLPISPARGDAGDLRSQLDDLPGRIGAAVAAALPGAAKRVVRKRMVDIRTDPETEQPIGLDVTEVLEE